MANSGLVMSAQKKAKNYKAQITLNPIPNNCYECPFYYMPDPNDEDSWYEYWDCYLQHIDDITGDT